MYKSGKVKESEAEKPSKLSKNESTDKYGLNFPGLYRNGYLMIFIALYNITYHSNTAKTLIRKANKKGHGDHEITITGVSIHGKRDRRVMVERIPHNTKRLYLEWSSVGHTPYYTSNITYSINNDPDQHGSFRLEQAGLPLDGYASSKKAD